MRTIKTYILLFFAGGMLGAPVNAYGQDMTVFVTSTSYTGSQVGGAGGASAQCQKRAEAAGLSGIYRAWISGSINDEPVDTFVTGGAYKLPDGTIIADNWADLIDGTLDNGISRDEFNNVVAGGTPVWTTVTASGTNKSPSFNCTEWTSTGSSGYTGLTGAVDATWTDDNTVLICNQSHRLYCFQQNESKLSSGSYNRVFVTSTKYMGNDVAGVGYADALCQQRAEAAGWSGFYFSWLSGSTEDEPQDRFIQSTDPYALVDGTKIADNWADLVNGAIDYAIIKDENGNWVDGIETVWTTAMSTGANKSTSNNCSGWTSSGGFGYTGLAGGVDAAWTDTDANLACNQARRLYCFQQADSTLGYANCGNPFGQRGDLVYNATHNVMQYCDGNNWIGIGK